ncbi:MAG: GNAT family N-acetyltransferase [Chitinophagaceae bacterium]
MSIEWVIRKFDELSPHELYSILQLRNIVFAIEQNCVYPDMDDKDQPSIHIMVLRHEQLIAYTRIIPPGIVYAEPSIGRVVTSPSARGEGIGKLLMEKSIEFVYNKFGTTPIRIGAQLYLKKFYSAIGFLPVGQIYLEDGIEHIEMIKP